MRWRWFVAMAMVLGCSCQTPARPVASTSATPTVRVPVTTGGIVEYSLPDAPDCPSPCPPPGLWNLAATKDGGVWYADGSRKVVGRVAPGGRISQFTTAPFEVSVITGAPDSSIWGLATGESGGISDWILHIWSSGEITKFPVGNRNWSGLQGVTVGIDGNIWFTELDPPRIVRMTPAGALSEFPLTARSGPNSIITGRDGTLWFAEGDASAIGEMTVTGGLIQHPITRVPSSIFPKSIVQGPDGSLWFIEFRNIVGRMSPTGELSTVTLSDHSYPDWLAAGPDGNVWFTDAGLYAVGRISPSGAVREFPLTQRSALGQIVAGADGHLWFANGERLASIGTRVPETEFSQPELKFSASSSQTLTVTNTGDGTLAIRSIAITGVDSTTFSTHADKCSGRSLAPGATCSVGVAASGGGGTGVRSAFLELSDNATGSPQKVPLVGWLPVCKLPVRLWNPQGGPDLGLAFLDITTGQAAIDGSSGFGPASATRTNPELPALPGNGSGYFDRAASRWLPVDRPEQVSPDGKRYAFALDSGNGTVLVHVVDVLTGKDRTYPATAGYLQVVGFTSQGVYLLPSYDTPGLWLLNPDSGQVRKVLSSGVVEAVDSSAAWIAVYRKAPDQPSQPAQFSHDGNNANEIDRVDLASGAATAWFSGGYGLYVRAIVNGSPVISASSVIESQRWYVIAPGQAQVMHFPFSYDRAQPYDGFISGSMGMWVGGIEGVYLWSPRTGGVLVSTQTGTPAGTCA